MNNIMRHRFTLREIILMIILAVVFFIGLYFLLVFYPVNNRIDELNKELQSVELADAEASADLAVYNRMKAAVEEIKKIPEDERTYMHFHTEEETAAINKDLSEIFAGTKLSTRRSVSNSGNNIIARRIDFTFTVSASEDPEVAYGKTKTMLYELTHRDNRRCLLGDLRLSPVGGDLENASEISVSGYIIFYELPQQQE